MLAFMLAAILTWPLAVFAQHPGDVPPWPDTGEPPCADVEASLHDACESREAAREALRARTSREYHAWLANRLVEDGGARNLAIAAQLRAMSLSGALFDNGESLPEIEADARISSWVAQATREGQDDGLVLMLLNRRLSTSDDARLAALRMQWQRIDPGNFMPAMFVAEARASGLDGLPELARGFSKFNVHFVEQLRVVVDAFERHPPDSEQASILLEGEVSTLRRYAATVGVFMIEFPRFVDAMNACRGDALTRTRERRKDCQHLGELFVDRSDTLIAHAIGLAILARSADDDAAREAIEARRRLIQWQMGQWQLLSLEPPTAEAEDAAVRALSTATSEIDLMHAGLKHHGIDLIPSPCWKHNPLQ